MLQGEYQHTLDAKGRLILPVKIREDLGATFFLTKGLDGCLDIYPMEEWIKFSERINSLRASSKEARRLKRYFIGSAVECEPDKQGRFLISPALREFAKIDKEVTVLGMGDHVEIWSKEVYYDYENDDVSIEEIAEMLEF